MRDSNDEEPVEGVVFFLAGVGYNVTSISSSGVNGTGMRDGVFLFFPDEAGVLPILRVSKGVGGIRGRRQRPRRP